VSGAGAGAGCPGQGARLWLPESELQRRVARSPGSRWLQIPVNPLRVPQPALRAPSWEWLLHARSGKRGAGLGKGPCRQPPPGPTSPDADSASVRARFVKSLGNGTCALRTHLHTPCENNTIKAATAPTRNAICSPFAVGVRCRCCLLPGPPASARDGGRAGCWRQAAGWQAVGAAGVAGPGSVTPR